MWTEFLRRWVNLAFWWLPQPQENKGSETATQAPPENKQQRETVGPEPATEQTRPQPTAAEPAPESPPTPEAAEDLTVIKGIGPATQKTLQELGITTIAGLASADISALTEKLKAHQPTATEARVKRWVDAAKDMM
jgi:predicted flap endonuclease-1-like 5' DNA nuclease